MTAFLKLSFVSVFPIIDRVFLRYWHYYSLFVCFDVINIDHEIENRTKGT